MLRLSDRIILGLFVCVALVSARAGVAGADLPARVAIVCGPQRTYRQAAAALQEALRRHGHSCVFIELSHGADESARAQTLRKLAEVEPTVVAASGTAATSLALEALPEIPVVFFMVPNVLDAAFVTADDPNRHRTTGVAADVSPREQIDWIARLAPSVRNVAVLHSPRTQRTVEALGLAARERGITVSAIEADRDRFPQAIDALNARNVNGVLMIPDARVYNSATVQRLLLWGIRQKRPVWGFSASIVKAGALAGQHSDGEAVGRQAAELVQKIIDGTPPGELGVRYPEQVGQAINQRTAEMIDLALRSGAIGAQTTLFGDRP